MPEIIQGWLGSKLGVLMDMTPERFGRNTKDGILLAKLLYKYGIIPDHVFNGVKESKNYHKCYSNLALLKPWLKYIGVVHDDSTLQQMACGEGSAAISVFYSVYLNLERKDRLHYLSAQKERRPSDDSCNKFKVSWVPERFMGFEAGDSDLPLAAPLYENTEVIEWHRERCKQVVEQIKIAKAKIRKVVEKKRELGPLLSKHATSQPIDRRKEEAKETMEEITAFEKKHPHNCPNLNFSELTELQNVSEMQPCFAPSLTEARNIVSNIRRRKKGDTYARDFQQKMQNILLDEEWKEIIDKQEKEFENKVCANFLKQSQYEKQMANKLQLMRNQKKVLAENRKKIECLKVDLAQQDYEESKLKNLEMIGEYWEEEEFEKERIKELHRRLYDEKARLRREKIRLDCRKIAEALVDIAIKISEFRQMLDFQIPKSFMKDMKGLFFKDLPIFDLLDHYEDICIKDCQTNPFEECLRQEDGHRGEVEGETDMYDNPEVDLLKDQEMERQSILDENDMNDYLHLTGPWMVELLFPNGSETEVNLLVLGYIVHKLLAIKYPSPNAPVRPDIKPMKPTCVVHGLTDETAVNMLKDLMEARGILLVRVDDAINFVLAAYKEELSAVRDIDIAFQKVTEDALQQRNSNVKDKDTSKKSALLKVTSPERLGSEDDYLMLDKETQTPRKIPEEDPILSPTAEFGKQAFEALGAGDPVPDPVIGSALVAYITSKQEEYNGWVLLNYPLLYSQASDLEYYLTGCRILPIMEEMETLEEAEGFSYRGPWGNSFGRDVFGNCRTSKLVPKPEILMASREEMPKTCFDSLIKLKKSPGTPRRRSQDSEEFGQMEKFYLDVGILSNFEYQSLNFQTIKDLGKEILKVTLTEESDLDVQQKMSVEIFGSVVLELNEKWEPKRKNTKEVGKKISNERKAVMTFPEEVEKEWEEEEYEEESTEKPEVDSLPPGPGDPGWEWATGSQPENFLVAVASLWENMEAVYIEDFRHVFFSLRAHRRNVVNYLGFTRKSIRILMRRPDSKQMVLGEFQRMFNEIDEDLRPDVDIKCELHVRVSELEQALMSVADERKRNSLKDLNKVSQDGWLTDEMANLINSFMSGLQLEVDRSMDSCQVIMDYYISLQQKIPDVKPLGKLSVPKLVLIDRKYSIGSTASNRGFGSPRNSDPRRSTKSDQSKVNKTRSLGDKKKRSSDSGLQGAAEFMMEILMSLSLPEDGMTPFHSFFIESFQMVVGEMKSVVETCLFEARKTDKTIASTRQTKNSKKPSDTNIASNNDNLVVEWITALENEVSRFIFRSQLLLARGIYDMNEFLTLTLNVLSSLSEEITEMYLKEIHSISECCKVFKCGIEEEIPILPILELKQDEFIVHMNDITSDEEIPNLDMSDERERFSFTIDQLNVLFQKLQRVAPDGEIIKRSLVYIFEDLRILNPEVENCKLFPEIWNDIEPDDVTAIMNEVFQDLEVVHWKDFIIYALELPLPTEMEILSMRRLFRKFDPLVTELITREFYDCVRFWFEKSSDDFEVLKHQQAKDLLYRMYQVNDLQTNYSAMLLAFCKDENPVLGFEKALTLAMGKLIKKYEESVGDSVQGETQSIGYGLFDEPNSESYRVKQCCCHTPSTEVTAKCIPREKILRCECKDEPESSVEKSADEQELNFTENAGEDERFFYNDSKSFGQSIEASFIPSNILSSLLKASFPSLPQLSILLDCQQTFQDTLNAIYDSLESYDNTLEVQKLINHKFIYRLLHSTNKFKFVKLKPILLSMAKPEPRVVCPAEKPNSQYCLRN